MKKTMVNHRHTYILYSRFSRSGVKIWYYMTYTPDVYGLLKNQCTAVRIIGTIKSEIYLIFKTAGLLSAVLNCLPLTIH